MAQGNKFTVLQPTGVPIEQAVGKTGRLDTLKGKRVGVLWNTRPDGDTALKTLLDLLAERYEVRETRFFKKHVFGVPATDAVLEDVANARLDAVITGIGD